MPSIPTDADMSALSIDILHNAVSVVVFEICQIM